MKSVKMLGTAFAVCVLAAGCGSTGAEKDGSGTQKVEWTFGSSASQANHNSKILDILGKEIKAKTDGQITVKPFYNGALWSAPEEIQAITTGLGDGGLLTVPVHEAALPVTAPGSWLPFALPSGEAAIDLMNHPVLGGMIKDELGAAGLVPITGSFGPATWFCTKELPNGVAPEDMSTTLDGLRIRAVGSVTSVVNALGGATVSTDIADLPIAVSQGQIDCAFTDWSSWSGLRLFESLPVAYDGLGSYGGILMVVAKSEFDKISKEAQADVLAAGHSATEKGLKLIQSMEADIKAEMGKNPKVQIIKVSPDDRARWAELAASVTENYAGKGDAQQRWADELKKMNEEGYTPSWAK